MAACTLLLATTAPTAQASRFAYVGDAGTPSVVPFAIGAGGQLAALPRSAMAATADPRNLAATPDGRYVYATDDSNYAVGEFAVNADGTLTSLGTVAVPGGASDIAVSPDGRSVYVAASDVYQFTVGADGRLTPKAAPSVTANSAYSVIVSPDGLHAYAANDTNGTIAQYDVAADGSLAPMSTPEVSAGGDTNIIYLAITPDGRALYGVINTLPAQVAQLTVGADGMLTPKSPATVATGTTPWGAAVSPDGRSLWVATNAGVSQYDIGADGSLSAKSPAIVTGATGGYMIWPTADGASVYVPDHGAGVDELDVSSTGALSPKSPSSASTGDPASSTEGIVVLPDQGPLASFTTGPAVARSPTAFDGSSSADVDGIVARYDWDFGDGATAIDAGPHPSHTYAAPGTYTVRLTETDDDGCSMTQVYTGHTAYCAGTAAATTTRSVTVTPAPIVGPPIATTGASRRIGLHTATLTGTVRVNGLATTYRFEYGLTTRYSSQTPPISAAPGSTPVAVARTLRGLAAGHRYHYRLVATNASGTSIGADRTFTTPRAVRAFTVHVRPARAQGPPYHYLFSGRLVLPHGMSRATGCRGRVSVQIKTGSHTISVGRTTITRACTWRSSVAVNSGYLVGHDYKRLGRRGTLRVIVRYLGTHALAPGAHRPFTIRFA